MILCLAGFDASFGNTLHGILRAPGLTAPDVLLLTSGVSYCLVSANEGAGCSITCSFNPV